MFRQWNVYPADQYGTQECPEDREPCGAFYGLPCSGEITRHEATHGDVRDFMPDTTRVTKDTACAHRRKQLAWDLVNDGWLRDLARPARKEYIQLARLYAAGKVQVLPRMVAIYQNYLQQLNTFE